MPGTLVSLTPVSLTNGVATKLKSTSTYASTIILYADTLNTGNIYWGGSNVTTSNGIPIAKNMSESITWDAVNGTNQKIDLSTIYLDADTTGNTVRVAYMRWDGA